MKYKLEPLFIFFTLILLSISICVGIYSYPQEDALILYRYVFNLVETGEITFNLYGERTEGATDFLWMIFLSIFLYTLKINPFITSSFLSALSFYVIIKIFHEKINLNKNLFIYFIFGILLLNTGQITGASMYGFSTLVFCGLGLITYLYAYEGKFIRWSIFSIIFCLFRPEAVIFFLPSIYFAFMKAKNDINLKSFFISFLTICLIGLFYFIWRYNYFGNFLPLPLTVKQYGGETSVIRYIATGSQLLSTLFIALLIPIVLFLIKEKKEYLNFKSKKFYNLLIVISLCLFYLFSISTGYQSQNIFFRYFAPIYFIVFLISMYCLSSFHILSTSFIVSVLFLILGSLDNSNLTNVLLKIEDRRISNPTYKISREFTNKSFGSSPIVAVANNLKNIKEDKTMIVTEAGVLPLVSKFKTIDIVGLNHNTYAYRPVNCKDIKTINPDIIEIDVGPLGNFFNFEKISSVSNILKCDIFDKKYLFNDKNIIDTTNLKLIKNYKYFNSNDEMHKNASTYVAASNILFCMYNDNNFNKVFVNQDSDQLYFIKNDQKAIENAIINSCDYSPKGYLK